MGQKGKETMSEFELRRTLNEIFDEYDKNKDQRLDDEDLKEMLNSIYERQTGKKGYMSRGDVRNLIAYYDSNGDGTLSKE